MSKERLPTFRLVALQGMDSYSWHMRRPFRHLGRFVAMLLIAVMAAVPVADAFACAFESESTHAAEAGERTASDPSGKQREADTQHGVCAHNHCHHTTADVPSDGLAAPDHGRGGAAYPCQDANRLSNCSDGLMRPPRA
ncbi:MAG: hypothetical protein JNM58_18635 [Xanthomonadaceae bacterium]|nr:hypothetical protein [Xanthomonadaceae bacterium]